MSFGEFEKAHINKRRKPMRKLTVLGIFLLASVMMNAQASRTWVSGVGDDANPCSRTAPCKTFAGAISKTAAGGEIDALDPAGYGAVTITKSITIDGGGGQVASVLVAGTNAIVVQAGPSDVVILRNLRLNGLRNSGNGGLSGIRFLSGASLIVDKCEIFGFNNNGVDVAMGASGQVWVTDTNIQNVGGTGIAATTTAGVVTVGVDQVRVELSNIGVQSGNHSRVTVNNSLIQNAGSAGVDSNGDAIASVNESQLDLNGSGVRTVGGGPVGQAFVSNSSFTGNSTAFNNATGTTTGFFSYGNNRLHGNTADTAGTISAAPATK